MMSFNIDKEYKGPLKFTLSVYLSNKTGILKLFKPRSKVFVTVDLVKHVVLIHKEFCISEGIKEAFNFQEIDHVRPDLSQKDKIRFYTEVFAFQKCYRFLFKNFENWYMFTEAFRHIHKDGNREALFKTNEGYLKLAISYLEDKQRNAFDFTDEDAARVIDSRSDSGDESSHNFNTQYQHDKAPDTIYSNDAREQDRLYDTKHLIRTDGNKFNPNDQEFDKTVAVNIHDQDTKYQGTRDTNYGIGSHEHHKIEDKAIKDTMTGHLHHH